MRLVTPGKPTKPNDCVFLASNVPPINTGHLISCYFHYFCFFLFAYVCLKALFTFFVALSTCTNNMWLKLILINIYKYDDLKLASSCRIVAPSSKGSQRLFPIRCYTKLPCLSSVRSSNLHKSSTIARYASTAHYLSSSLSS